MASIPLTPPESTGASNTPEQTGNLTIPGFLGYSPGTDFNNAPSFSGAFKFFAQGSHKIIYSHRTNQRVLFACTLDKAFRDNIDREFESYLLAKASGVNCAKLSMCFDFPGALIGKAGLLRGFFVEKVYGSERMKPLDFIPETYKEANINAARKRAPLLLATGKPPQAQMAADLRALKTFAKDHGVFDLQGIVSNNRFVLIDPPPAAVNASSAAKTTQLKKLTWVIRYFENSPPDK